jgi:uncharacterized UPF0160 family protein
MKIVTHDSSFHIDDIFAVAVLLLLYPESKVVRTRNPKEIESADFAVDVGMVNDPSKHRFDHHMLGGAGERENGIPYASFGLVWKEFGEKLSGGKREADIIDKRLIQAIDASDNGISIADYNFNGIRPYTIGDFFSSFVTSIGTDADVLYKVFMDNVKMAKELLQREIMRAKETAIGEDITIDHYKSSPDKRLIELPREGLPWEILANFPEPLYVVYPRRDGHWGIRVVPDISKPFGNTKKPLPVEWAAKTNEDLQKVTGVPDALFVHSKRFMASAKTREGALALAKEALNA